MDLIFFQGIVQFARGCLFSPVLVVLQVVVLLGIPPALTSSEPPFGRCLLLCIYVPFFWFHGVLQVSCFPSPVV